jgi:hypothetical protein
VVSHHRKAGVTFRFSVSRIHLHFFIMPTLFKVFGVLQLSHAYEALVRVCSCLELARILMLGTKTSGLLDDLKHALVLKKANQPVQLESYTEGDKDKQRKGKYFHLYDRSQDSFCMVDHLFLTFRIMKYCLKSEIYSPLM